jgi:hypothetical protein
MVYKNEYKAAPLVVGLLSGALAIIVAIMVLVIVAAITITKFSGYDSSPAQMDSCRICIHS